VRTFPRRAAALAPAVVALGACAGGAPLPAAGPPATEQRVGLTEWEVVTEGRPLRAGEVRLVVTNAGAAPHDLAVRVGTEARAATPVLDPGQVHELAFSAVAGERVELWCTLTGHHAAGMHLVVDVAAAP
jgi:hypothetical protein